MIFGVIIKLVLLYRSLVLLWSVYPDSIQFNFNTTLQSAVTVATRILEKGVLERLGLGCC